MAAIEVKTFKDIQDAIQEELKITDTTTVARIKRDINLMYRDIASRKRWDWLKKFITLTHKKFIDTGTASVTLDSHSVTLSSAPSISVQGYWFKADGHSEIYKVEQHTAGATAVVLQTSFTNDTNAATSYRLWTDKVPLPIDCSETIEVSHQWRNSPLFNIGRQEFREKASRYSTNEGYPYCYSTNDYSDPDPFEGNNVGTSATRSSDKLVKTIVFGSSVASTLETGDRIQVSGAADASYNGDHVVRSVATTTITFVGLVSLSETSTADVSINVKKLTQKTTEEAYRDLWVYPSQFKDHDITLHVDYIQTFPGLEDDTDEPLMPIDDRMILVYAALSRAWVKQRNPETAGLNERLFEAKLARMAGKAGDSSDYPNINVDPLWASAKRRASRRRG